MIDATYDPEADAVYVRVGRTAVDHTEEAGLFIYDLDSEGRVVGIEVLAASRTLAPGDWQKAPRPGSPRVDAAE